MARIAGRAWKFGDDVDTDVIIPARYLYTHDPGVLAAHCLEVADPRFPTGVRPGDVVVAGRNFGCGSSREHAPRALQACGVAAVVAASFARIFFRNAVNLGLLLVESPEAVDRVQPGEYIEIDGEKGLLRLSSGETIPVRFPEGAAAEVQQAGGLVEYVRSRLAARAVPAPGAGAEGTIQGE
ncbi:MAG: 3-isopropylmalate dehydratase small subunit [Bacillota bacterium]|nr:3-isopropylmalate dehydratase small subunit [Bacillota bacterium]